MRRFAETRTDEILEGTAPAREELTESIPKNGKVVNSIYVNLRRSPSEAPCEIMMAVPRGTEVEIIKEVSDYYKVRYKGDVYYVAKQFCEEE